MLLDTSTTLTPGSFAVGPVGPQTPTTIRVPGATLLVVPQVTTSTAEGVLKSLRGFRGDGRRVAWCNMGELARTGSADLRAWGRRIVEEGGAAMVVVCGNGGRDVAVGARDAGLALGRVVVCRDEATARNVLGDSIVIGDAVLALGIGMEGCQRLTDRLESRFSRTMAVAGRAAAAFGWIAFAELKFEVTTDNESLRPCQISSLVGADCGVERQPPPLGLEHKDALLGGFWVSCSRALLHDEIYV